MDNKNNKNEDIYSSLKGYFPDEYDMSPEELEKTIETENKERNIALGMTDPHRSSVPVPKAAAENPEETATAEEAPIEEPEDIMPEVFSPEEEVFEQIPDVQIADRNNDLLEGYDSLDSLFEELEAEKPESEEAEAIDTDKLTGDVKARKVVDWFFDFLEVFTICMACIIVFFSFVARLTRVDGKSMNDTLQNGEYLLVSDLFYEPAVGDIVVLQNTSLSTEQLRNPLVKRVMAVGGETIRISIDGTVSVTGADGEVRQLDQSFIKKEPYQNRIGEQTVVVPEGYVFVMGDNRNNSTDSRDSRVGLVDERCIFGKAYFRVLPLGSITAFKNPYTGK